MYEITEDLPYTRVSGECGQRAPKIYTMASQMQQTEGFLPAICCPTVGELRGRAPYSSNIFVNSPRPVVVLSVNTSEKNKPE